MQNLDQAFKNFFEKRAKYPKFKRKHGAQSSCHCSNLKIAADTIKIPKISAIRANIHREIVGKVKSITITRNAAGKYSASILADDVQEAAVKPTCITRVTGYDLGLSHYLIDNNGGKVANPRHLINAYRRLRRDSKALSRKKPWSANHCKARLRLAAQHERGANARADFQHKLSRRIIDENQAVIVETLKSANMMKNHSLARATDGAGWTGTITILEYKAAEKGVHQVKLEQWSMVRQYENLSLQRSQNAGDAVK